jgi:hypothetical protein
LQAVQLDTRDGTSWSILGNAYLAHLFSVSQNPRTLKQAMSAYKQAVRDYTRHITWDRCYDFKTIFANFLGEEIGVFCSNYCQFL